MLSQGVSEAPLLSSQGGGLLFPYNYQPDRTSQLVVSLAGGKTGREFSTVSCGSTSSCIY